LTARARNGRVAANSAQNNRLPEENDMNYAPSIRATLATLLLIAAGSALSQAWPTQTVRVLVPFPPGGGTDIQARLLSNAFQKSMGQNFIVDNRTGANGLIATHQAVASPPDGNTILFTSGSL
jgi:tripartite-type tricarboxylate transporter receptor subunit TctC